MTTQFAYSGRISLCVAAFVFLTVHTKAMADDPSAPAVQLTQYAGDNLVAVRWRDVDYGVAPACGVASYGLFGRAPGGDFELKADLRDTTDRMWFGSVDGLSASTPLELQVRRKVSADSASGYCHTPTENAALVDTTNIDNPPSMQSQGDVRLTFDQVHDAIVDTLRFYIDVELIIGDWASRISDGDDAIQPLLNNLVYSINSGFEIDFQDNFGAPSPALRVGYFAYTLDRSQYIPDGFSVLQFCNVSNGPISENWVGACSTEKPVVVSMDPSTPGAENVPSFNMSNSLAIGADYNLQGYEGWASNINAGANAVNPELQFHTLWVTNPHLYDVVPYLSNPSGSLRFKFKPGVSGISRVYFSLGDWSKDSPENKLRFEVLGLGEFNGSSEFRGYGGNFDLPPDHSAIQYVDIQAGDINATGETSPGVAGADVIASGNSATTGTASQNTAGGGALGGLFLLTGLAGLIRRRTRHCNAVKDTR